MQRDDLLAESNLFLDLLLSFAHVWLFVAALAGELFDWIVLKLKIFAFCESVCVMK
jgi:hypothetical protein